MRTTRAAAVGLVVFCFAPPARADETPARGKIVAADLFKNGLAAVTCEVTLGKAGTYALSDVPQPVHGTYWVESAGRVETAVRVRDVDVPAADAPPGDPQEDFAGKKVTLHLKGGGRPPVVGVMAKLKPAKPGEDPAPTRFLVVQTAKGRAYIEAGEVTAVESEDAGGTVKRRQPRLLLTLAATDKAETKVTLRYLTHGLSWAPSYRIDITDPKTLTVEQAAAVRNELADLDGAEVRLISGYPSVQFAHVRSLLAPRTTWATFFAELGSGGGRDSALTGNAFAGQGVAFNTIRTPHAPALGATPTGEGVDLHFEPIGKRTLAEGETLSLTVAAGKAGYERVVEWVVPDTRDDHGRQGEYARGRGEDDPGRGEDGAWDALKFKNPLPFPMTTGPATVTANGRFNGQRASYWVNPGEETVLRVEKALSVRTRAAESERPGKDEGGREFTWVGGRQYRKGTVEGELAVGNHRKEAVTVLVRRRFSGELVKADGAPAATLLGEGVASVNKRNELVWAVALKPGEEKTLKYTYTVLMPH